LGELLVLLLDLLGVLARRAEQQVLQVAEQVLAGGAWRTAGYWVLQQGPGPGNIRFYGVM
jgi:hypothetical protein